VIYKLQLRWKGQISRKTKITETEDSLDGPIASEERLSSNQKSPTKKAQSLMALPLSSTKHFKGIPVCHKT
jgi:hypothetical protein